MLDYISTNQTEFFREPHHFTFLRERVLPELEVDKTVRIWSTACSSGEEPYSIAMTLSDAIASPSTWNCRILASDISTRMLAKAATGQYSHEKDQFAAVRSRPSAFSSWEGRPHGTCQDQAAHC